MRFAYLDPPYLGKASKHYGEEAAAAGRVAREVNHELLIAHACEEFDGWALSLSSPSLRTILPMCPDDARVMAWVKPFHAFKRNVNPSYGWEPVIVWHPRPRPGGGVPFLHGYRDWVETEHLEEAVSCSITLRKGFTGVKPEGFCFWLFEVLNLQPGDELVDVFPGSGAVTDALDLWWQTGPHATPTVEPGAFDFAAAASGTQEEGR